MSGFKTVLNILSLFLLTVLTACQGEDAIVGEALPIGLSLERAGGTTSDRELSYTICLFRAAKISERKDADFECTEVTPLPWTEVNSYSFKVDNEDKGKYVYRLFIHATPSEKAQTLVSIAKGEGYDQLKIQLAKEDDSSVRLSEDNYYAIEELDESDLSGTAVIKLQLNRLVGRLVFDLFKADENGPIDLDLAKFGSTLDRVQRIEMRVEGITTCINVSGLAAIKSEEAFTDFSVDTKLKDDYRLEVSEQDPACISAVLTKEGKTIDGGVRLFTSYLLPTGNDGNDILKAQLTFWYVDEYAEDSALKELTLNLPSGTSNYLRVVGNCYTLTNIRLKNNRIIDLGISGDDVTIETGWK